METTSPDAKKMFLHNEFPDEIIAGALSNDHLPQPDNMEKLRRSLMKVKDEMNEVEILWSKSTCKGKTKHPGLNYFNATEWLQFAEMHLRHHFRQKKRIDAVLSELGLIG